MLRQMCICSSKNVGLDGGQSYAVAVGVVLVDDNGDATVALKAWTGTCRTTKLENNINVACTKNTVMNEVVGDVLRCIWERNYSYNTLLCPVSLLIHCVMCDSCVDLCYSMKSSSKY